MLKLVHIHNLLNTESNEPIVLNLNSVCYLRYNYDLNCTMVYFSNGQQLLIKESLTDLK